MALDRLIEKIEQTQNPTVAGLDPKLDYVPEYIKKKCFEKHGETLKGAAKALYEFNKGLIDALYDIVPAVKPQAAYYEMYGTAGVKALYKTQEYARSKGMYVITDGKRNDIGYTLMAWGLVHGFPAFFIQIFNQDADLIAAGVPAMQIYYFGFFMMSLQFAGQSTFTALGKSKKAVFFSIFRKIVIVSPLILLLPELTSLGTDGIFMAEPISNFIGGLACYGTMLFTVWPELSRSKTESSPAASDAPR